MKKKKSAKWKKTGLLLVEGGTVCTCTFRWMSDQSLLISTSLEDIWPLISDRIMAWLKTKAGERDNLSQGVNWTCAMVWMYLPKFMCWKLNS
jgi:hypothetical protein